MKAIANLRFR